METDEYPDYTEGRGEDGDKVRCDLEGDSGKAQSQYLFTILHDTCLGVKRNRTVISATVVVQVLKLTQCFDLAIGKYIVFLNTLIYNLGELATYDFVH